MPRTVVRHESEHLYADEPNTPAGQRLSRAILHFRNAERIQAEHAQRLSGLSSLDLAAIRYLVQGYRDGRDLSPKDLIVMLDTSSATVTNVVERLVERGYVTRVQHPTDRRAHYLVPTEDAVRLVDDAYEAHHSALVGVIQTLSPTQAETAADVITHLADALDRLVARETEADAALERRGR
jgi:DNA-binding MarR family transcriptional regulator